MLKLKERLVFVSLVKLYQKFSCLLQFTNTHTKIKHGYPHQDYLKGKISEKL